jgi:hypothetical protein
MLLDLDLRILLLLAIVIVMICVITKTENFANATINNYTTDTCVDTNDTNGTKTKTDEKSTYIIKIGTDTYEKMVDAVTNYSLMSNEYNLKLVLIYLSTFHLFDMNYGFNAVKLVDDRLASYPYIPNDVEYPSGNLHKNIQKAIITHITKQIDGSERQLTNDYNADRKIIDLYLGSLFDSIGVI